MWVQALLLMGEVERCETGISSLWLIDYFLTAFSFLIGFNIILSSVIFSITPDLTVLLTI
jgi:hypothetical protein